MSRSTPQTRTTLIDRYLDAVDPSTTEAMAIAQGVAEGIYDATNPTSFSLMVETAEAVALRSAPAPKHRGNWTSRPVREPLSARGLAAFIARQDGQTSTVHGLTR